MYRCCDRQLKGPCTKYSLKLMKVSQLKRHITSYFDI